MDDVTTREHGVPTLGKVRKMPKTAEADLDVLRLASRLNMGNPTRWAPQQRQPRLAEGHV